MATSITHAIRPLLFNSLKAFSLDGATVKTTNHLYKLVLVHQNMLNSTLWSWRPNLHGTTALRMGTQLEQGFFNPTGNSVYHDLNKATTASYADSRLEEDSRLGSPCMESDPNSHYNQGFLKSLSKKAGLQTSLHIKNLLERAYSIQDPTQRALVTQEIQNQLKTAKDLVQKTNKPLILEIYSEQDPQTNTCRKDAETWGFGKGMYNYFVSGNKGLKISITKVYELQEVDQ